MYDTIERPAETTFKRYSDLFTALGDPVRLAIIYRLSREGEMSVGELGRPFAISAPAISRHLKVLERASVIERRVDRQWRICSLRRDDLEAACTWMSQMLAPRRR